MRTMNGDLIALAKAGQFDVIAHGCNCHHAMGGGLAAQIKRHFPTAHEADLATPYGDPAKLGTCSIAEVPTAEGSVVIVNAYTQFQPSGGAPGVVDVDYAAVGHCMSWMKRTFPGRRIGLPQIGAGLAGGDWSRIEAIIAAALGGEDVTIVVFRGGV